MSIRKKIKSLFNKFLTLIRVKDDPLKKPVSWDKCTLASCWDGSNAQRRMMNILSPHFDDNKVKEYIKWQKGRGANTTHLILCNHKDGEGGGYSIYGNSISWTVDKNWTKMARSRIELCRKEGLAVVIWLMTDDDSGWNRSISSNFPQYLRDVKSEGLLDHASTVCVGLELDEYYNSTQVRALVDATRQVYGGMVATHHTSGKAQFAGMGDLLFYQEKINLSDSQIRAATNKALSYGKPVNFFELARGADKHRSQVALDAGAYAVGNI